MRLGCREDSEPRAAMGHGRRSRQEGTGRTPGTTSGATAPLGGSLGPRGSQNARGTNCGATGPRGPVAGDPQRAERRCHRPRALRISSGGGRGRAGNMNSPSPAMPTGSFFLTWGPWDLPFQARKLKETPRWTCFKWPERQRCRGTTNKIRPWGPRPFWGVKTWALGPGEKCVKNRLKN